MDLSLRLLGITSGGGSIDITQFPGRKTYIHVVIARNILEVSKDIGYLNCEIGITVLILLQYKNYKVFIKLENVNRKTIRACSPGRGLGKNH